FDTRVDGQTISIDFDALKKVPGASWLGDFHYVPVLFQEGAKVGQHQRLLFAILGVVLGDLQGRPPEYGLLLSGDRCRGTKVQLKGSLRDRAMDILREIEELRAEIKPPKLMLNR